MWKVELNIESELKHSIIPFQDNSCSCFSYPSNPKNWINWINFEGSLPVFYVLHTLWPLDLKFIKRFLLSDTTNLCVLTSWCFEPLMLTMVLNKLMFWNHTRSDLYSWYYLYLVIECKVVLSSGLFLGFFESQNFQGSPAAVMHSYW